MDQYRDIIANRIAEVRLGWQKNTAFISAHVAGYLYIMTHFYMGHPLHILACIGGVVGAGLWFFSMRRNREYLRMWHDRLKVIEREATYSTSVFTSEEFEKLESARIKSGTVYLILIWIIGAAWFTTGIISSTSINLQNVLEYLRR